jgi:hypothetical protein
MKNLSFYLKFAIVLVIIGWIAKAWALKPVAVPDHIIAESAGAVTIHKGSCKTSAEEAMCIVGHVEETDTFWLLLFEDGVLYKVMTVKNGKEETKWLHPSKGA